MARSFDLYVDGLTQEQYEAEFGGADPWAEFDEMFPFIPPTEEEINDMAAQAGEDVPF